MATNNTCPKCGKPMTCHHCVVAKGGRNSKRKITPEQQRKMQLARKQKRILT